MRKFFSATVWFIESRYEASVEEPPSMGSGVVIWLKKTGKDSDPKKFLLTSSHVVRGGTLTGPLQTKIACWPCGKSYVPVGVHDTWPDGPNDGTWTAKVFDLLGRSPAALDQHAVSAAGDWVLLELDDADFQEYPSISGWGMMRHGRSVTVVGYPGGSDEWHIGSPVEPYEATGFTNIESVTPGTLRLKSKDRAAGGMSGGGLFESDGTLVGLHRGQSKGSLQFEAVRAEHIQAKLSAQGYELVPGMQPPTKPPRLLFALAVLVILAFVAFQYTNQKRPERTTDAIGLGHDFEDFKLLWNTGDPRKKAAIVKDIRKYEVSTNWDHVDVIRSEPIDETKGVYYIGHSGEVPEVKMQLNDGFHKSAANRGRTLDNVRGHLLVDNVDGSDELTISLTSGERKNLIEHDPISFDDFRSLTQAGRLGSVEWSEFEGVRVSNWTIPEIREDMLFTHGGSKLYELVNQTNKSYYIYVVVDKNETLEEGAVVAGTLLQASKESIHLKVDKVR